MSGRFSPDHWPPGIIVVFGLDQEHQGGQPLCSRSFIPLDDRTSRQFLGLFVIQISIFSTTLTRFLRDRSIPMFRAFLGVSVSLCSYEFSDTSSVKFRELDLEAGETICLKRLPPFTSAVFNSFPRSFFYVNYQNSSDSAFAVGTSRTTGFYTGNSRANVTACATDAGTFSYFIVSFPPDCSERIVSNTLPDTITRMNTTDRICYFNGAQRDLSYRISVRSKSSGILESSMLDAPLIGDQNISLEFVDPSIISWCGEMNSVTITVRGRPRKHPELLESRMDGTPAFLEYDPLNNDDRINPMLLVIDSVIIVLVLIGIRVSCVRRKMKQRKMREDEAIPVIATGTDPQQIPSQYIYVPVTCHYAIDPDPVSEPLNCEE
jgi:hypothetical protein